MRELKLIRPNIFARGGDTSPKALNGDQKITARQTAWYPYDIRNGHGSKVQSSSKLVKKSAK